MQVLDALQKLQLGNSVAEFDRELDRYFVVTDTFRALVADRADIIAGDKGTGKTAIYQCLKRRYTSLPELANVEVIAGFNPAGSPVFQRLGYEEPLSEAQYVTVWKTYFLSLVGNWLLQLGEGAHSEAMRRLEALLNRIGLRSADDTPMTVFSRLTSWLRTVRPKPGLEITFNDAGIPVWKPLVEFDQVKPQAAPEEPETIPHHEALQILNDALAEHDITVWLVLDRLDEAFVGFPDIEIPVLRALVRTYLDLLAFDRIRLKLFVRKDLSRRIMQGGFVNLTHVNARKLEIVWDDEDLFTLLSRRIKESREFLDLTGLQETSNQQLFEAIFPDQVDPGKRRPGTWSWILNQIRDGNEVKSPRNLIDLVIKAQEEQLRRENRAPRPYVPGVPLLEPEAFKRALTRLSEQRVEDTLLAEGGPDVAVLVEAFRNGKAEHNEQSIARLFGVDGAHLRTFIKVLLDIGFLEQTGDTYKVPVLYREGLRISQGRAF